MKTNVILGLSSLFLASGIAAAQQMAGNPTPPPKVLVIDREYIKPGKSGSLHVKTESAFVKAMSDAKYPTHYIAMDSLSGPNRALFFIGYDSFEAWGKDQEAQQANAALTAATDQAMIDDGELLTEAQTHVFLYHPEMSVHAAVDIPHMRYFEITSFAIKPGHEKEWNDLVKVYTTGYDSIPDAHWAMFESIYGENNGGVWIAINPMRTMAEADKGMANGKQFEAAQGDAGMKHAGELAADCIQSVQTNVFVVNPKMSYAADEWAQSAPEIWGQH